jgi:hypothetical protein
MAKKFKKFTSEKEELFVFGFTSRPVLHVKPKELGKAPMWLGFSDTLIRYGSGLGESDLGLPTEEQEWPLKGNSNRTLLSCMKERWGSHRLWGQVCVHQKKPRENWADAESDTPRKRVGLERKLLG